MEKLINRITAEMERQNISQADLGRKVGATRGAINGLLAERFTPSPELVIAIYKALGLTEDEALMDLGLKSESDEKRRSASEERLLDLYNQLSEEGKTLVEKQIREVLIPLLGKSNKKKPSRKVMASQ